jgi:predicted PurR-regulated permease PerM
MGGNNLGGGVFNAQKRNNNNNNLEGQQWRAEIVDFVYSLISSLENVYIHTVGIFFFIFFLYKLKSTEGRLFIRYAQSEAPACY